MRNQPARGRPVVRSRLGDAEERLARKRRQQIRRSANARSHGLVEVPGPLSGTTRREIESLANRTLENELRRDPHARILGTFDFARGVAFETSSEKLAQHLADAIEHSRGADVVRTFDDEGQRRILTCHLKKREG